MKHRLDLVHDYTLADCVECELVPRRPDTQCLAQKPKVPSKFNGLMLIGEGPGFQEAKLKIPFIGPSGKLLDALLAAAGIDRNECYVTNATLCMPPKFAEGDDPKKSFNQRFPKAVMSCMPRLLTEIRDVNPRVILAFGQAALDALTGVELVKNTKKPFHCNTCEGLPKRSKKCPECAGYKTRVTPISSFKSDHSITFVAGGVFHADALGIEATNLKYVIPSIHPSFLLRKAKRPSPAAKQIGGQYLANAVVHHLQKAKRLLEEDAKFEFTYEVTQDPDRVAEYTAELGMYSVDIETDGDNTKEATKINCIGINRIDSTHVLVCDTEDLPPEHPLIQELNAFMEDERVFKTMQGGIYDTKQIKKIWRGITKGWKRDTMVAHHALAPDEPHNLSHLGFQYTDISPWKPPKEKNGVAVFKTKSELFLYNARDVRVTSVVTQRIGHQLELEQVQQVHDLDLVMCNIAREMSLAGMPVDEERWKEGASIAAAGKELHLREMRKLIGEPEFNPNSNPQLHRVLYAPNGPLKLRVPHLSDSGGPATDKVALQKLSDCAFVRELQAYRGHAYVLSNTFAMPVIDGRVFADWKPLGTISGRWTSEPNFQNWKRLLRALIRARKGRKFVGADQEQLEARISALFSADPELFRRTKFSDSKKKLDPDWDPHSYVAWATFGVGFTRLNINDPNHLVEPMPGWEDCKCERCQRAQLREISKTVFYALAYGSGAETIVEGIYKKGYDGPPITVALVKQIVAGIFRVYKNIPAWREQLLRDAARDREVKETILGRKRVFPLGQVDAPVVFNFPVQAGGAAIMNLGLKDLYERLYDVDPTALFIAQVHDAIYIECDEDKSDKVRRLVQDCLACELELPSNPLGAMPFIAKGKVGQTWLEVS